MCVTCLEKTFRKPIPNFHPMNYKLEDYVHTRLELEFTNFLDTNLQSVILKLECEKKNREKGINQYVFPISAGLHTFKKELNELLETLKPNEV